MLVGEYFRLQGFRVLEFGGGGADGGVDLVLLKGGESQVVQCKQWKAYKVGVQVVRELYGVMAAKGASAGYVITSGTFTQDATEFASGRNITLIDGGALIGLIKQVRQSLTQRERAVQSKKEPLPSLTPDCPACKTPMVLRTASRGKNTGAVFWGCRNFPSCRETMHL